MDLKSLKKTRASHKAKLTIFKSYIDTFLPNKILNKVQVFEITARLNKIQDLYNEFDSVQTDIEGIVEIPGDEHKEREIFETSYFGCVAVAQELLNAASAGQETGSVASSSDKTGHPGLPNIKLPTIKLPIFSGRYQEWLEYHDTYKSLIHDNTTIPKIHKFHYLRNSLKDTASLIIKSLEFSADNYDVAWDLLCDRYHNDRILVNNHIQELFKIQPVVKESSQALRNTIDSVNRNLRALKTLHLPTEHWDMIIIHMVTSKLDPSTIRDWERERNSITRLPTLHEFNTFLKNRADILETIEESSVHTTQQQSQRRHSDITHNRSKTFLVNQPTKNQAQFKCPVCKNNHTIYQCVKFKSMPIETRIERVKQLNLCTNCLRAGHDEQRCRLSSCRLCTQRHNTLLHNSNTVPKASISSEECVVLPTMQEQKQTESNSVTLSSVHHNQVLLSTAIINIQDSYGLTHKVRALLDNGSTSSFITETLRIKLGIPSYSTSLLVQGLNNQSSKITQRCDVTISSLTNSGYTTDVNCFIVPHITQLIPTSQINCNSFSIPARIHLADPSFSTPSEVQMLLGADIFWDVLLNNHIALGKNKPTLIETTLGWLVTGSIQSFNSKLNTNQKHTVHCHFLNNNEIEEKLNKFFELESVPSTQQIHTKGESECEQIFTQTTKRHPDGKFIVIIPLKESSESLGDSKQQALIRFQSLERKFKRNPEFKEKYTNFLDEYLSLGHMSENNTTHKDSISYFMPHHGVLREDSSTTKLRTVFDCSATTSTGKSLNDIQHIGPTVQDDLLSILIRFRQYKFVVTSDIEKMYRQIYVHNSQRCLQQIFWRSDPSQPIKQYKLNTVTYGMSSAPYLATRCLVQLGQECTDKDVRESILHDFYVDDYISGHEDEKTLIQRCQGVIKILEGAHFHLRKWRSNKPSILDDIIVNENNNTDNSLNLNKVDHAKTLGLLWTCKKDTLLFSVNNISNNKNTNKRTILSTIAQVFDPLGLINPCMLQAKLILQTLWSKNITWDDQLPAEVESQWHKFIQDLPEISKIEIPRRVLCDLYVKVELHAFSDASIKAFSACIYVRTVSDTGNVQVRLLLAKSRVAPLKQRLTMPKLELCGALLATRLMKKVISSLRLGIDSSCFWCDSTIVLGWIKTCKSKLKQFVYNRINYITNNSDPNSWSYVPTEMNPADIGSRGLNASQLQSSLLWWGGPHFLHQTDMQMPTQPQNINITSLPEIKHQCYLSADESHCHTDDYFTRFSNFNKLQCTLAYVQRFIFNCQHTGNKMTGPLTVKELNTALKVLCKQIQRDSYCKQYLQLMHKRQLSPKDKLLKLNPFIDHEGIIRVGGRLLNSHYDYNTKHPILLDASHHITKILVAHYHKILLHAGPQLLLATLRHKYWIVNGRNLCRKITRDCICCLRFAGKTYQPIMGNLPLQRLQADYPFSNTAVDYAGPILISNRKGRGTQLKKSYIAVFVCLAVRAVHIELVTDLSSEGFIAALNRFVARRGKPATIYSDNGTNFVGACNEITKFLKTQSYDIISNAAENDIIFKFSPAYSPHFNGVAEGSVKSIKKHLNHVLSMAHLDYEEMNTVLIQIEAILNSRPLTPISSDPSDLIPLTPAHFLIGRTLTMLPAPQVDQAPLHTLSRYKRVQALKTHFWNRYYKEYVSELQIRNKWRTDRGQPQPGDMVIIKDDRLPPNRWLLGRITNVYPGMDGVNRVADVATTSGTIRRAWNRLCPLPMKLDQHDAPAPRGPVC
ncbi:uncharacterized protein LOC111358355 [Spodoptera litura]|uniref:Uncharacterized protein LOC111358355 n=1 Tax=Spodoptera litura TaxID=69820 RepID=A0A9J7EIR5_SPOLT|nr:uncharacterized protein LOC111358355 [Spodoptera litura]